MTQPNRNAVTRRGLLAAAGAVAVGAAATGLVGADPAQAAAPILSAPEPTGFGPVTVRPDDIRYDSLLRGDNFRFVGDPAEIRVVGSTPQVIRAVQDAVRSGARIAARSGGHCFENFTADPAVRMLLDLSPMDAVGYDAARRPFVVQPGARLGHVYTTLFTGWGVTIPAGSCPDVGAGGHFAGGGYGPLSRRYGSVVDYIYAVEVVVVDRDGTVRAVIASREPDDPYRDLWWAHTGGGGGNFGVVTRYWLRSPNVVGTDPSTLLPPAPRQKLSSTVEWGWDAQMTEQVFTTLLRNFSVWHERNSAPDSPYAGLFAVLIPLHKSAGRFLMEAEIDADLPNADDLVTDLIAAVTAGTGVTPSLNARIVMPWLHPTTWPGAGEPGDVVTRRYKFKAAYLRRSFTDTQFSTIYWHLTNTTGIASDGMLLVGYGGQVDAVAPDATAIAQRDVIMKAVYQTIWAAEADDAANLCSIIAAGLIPLMLWMRRESASSKKLFNRDRNGCPDRPATVRFPMSWARSNIPPATPIRKRQRIHIVPPAPVIKPDQYR